MLGGDWPSCHYGSMAKTWLSISVELLGGRGEELWPWPGRLLAVGPSHTFEDLAEAINDAFARWDRSHLSVFTLADGRIVTDQETGAEMAESMAGPLVKPIDFSAAKVVRTVEPGAEFQFVFDLGDGWTHRCSVAGSKVDPVEVLGIRPSRPLPYWGWGTIPDQYGRRWTDDDGYSRVPNRPGQRHPMLTHQWPEQQYLPELDLSEVRRNVAAADAEGFLEALMGKNIDDALQQVGAGIPMVLEQRKTDGEPVAASVINRLTFRGFPGDQELAEQLLAALRDEPLEGKAVPVDLEMLSSTLEGEIEFSAGAYVDLHTGEVISDILTDPATAGDDLAIDTDKEPERWLWLDRFDARLGWEDMALFGQRQHDPALRERIERAIDGRGAFGRFRDLVHDEGLAGSWRVFSDDRRIGRARQLLAAEGVVVR